MEATVSSINSRRREQEVTTPGWAAGEAGSSLCPVGGLPGKKIQLTHRKSLVSQTVNSLNTGSAFNSWALQRYAVEIQRINKCHS